MDSSPRMDRRTALKWMLTAAASAALAPHMARAQALAKTPGTKGYGTDPDMMKEYSPGEVWPLTLSDAQRRTASALSDVIIPADEESPAASAIGIVDFLDEWVSAPYPTQQSDRAIVLPGLAWIDEEAKKRFGREFAQLDEAQKTAICDDIAFTRTAKPEFKKGAAFFALYRNLTAGGYFTTPQGRTYLRYVGNMPLAVFEGPPESALRQAGVI